MFEPSGQHNAAGIGILIAEAAKLVTALAIAGATPLAIKIIFGA